MAFLRSILSLAVALLALGATETMAQSPRGGSRLASRAILRGKVVGEDGRPLAGAIVLVPALDRRAATDSAGAFTLRDLPASSIALQVRALGHQPVARQLTLTPGTPVFVNVTLPPSTVSLVPMVVTGTATVADPTTPLDVAAIDPEKLKSVATGSLGKTLERVPGVTTITTGPMAGNPVLRGLSQGHVRLTRDGLAVETFQGTSRWTPPISLGSVERIEVIRGPASVLYGSSALGGAINFLAKPLPRSEAGESSIAGLLEGQYFSNNGEYYGNAELSGAFGPGIGFRAGLNQRIAGEFQTASVAPYSATQRKGDPKFTGSLPFTNFEQRARYAQLGHSANWGQIQALYDGFRGYNNFLNANGRPAGVLMDNNEARLRTTVLRGSWILKPSLVYQDLRIQRAATTARTFEDARANRLWDQDIGRQSYVGRFEAEHAAIRGFAGKVGVEVSRQVGTTRKSAIEPSSKLRNVAGFLFEEYRLPRLTLSAGVRYDHRDQEAEEGSLVGALPASERESALNRTFSVFTGSLGAGIRLTDALTWTTSFNSGFRAPAAQDLYTNENRPAFGWLEGDPTLNPERSFSVETGVRLQAGRFAAQATAYQNHVSDYIYMRSTDRTRRVGTETRLVYQNAQSDARLRGFELSAEAEAASRLFAEASYALVRGVNKTTDESLPLMPADQLRGSLRYAPTRFLAFKAPYARVGGRYVQKKAIAGKTEPFAEFDNNPQGFGIASTPSYAVFEAGLGGSLAVGAQRIDTHLEVQNLFDRPYRDFLDTMKGFALAQGRNVALRVSVPFVVR